MKFALIILIAFVALSSQQQFQRRMIWMSPYSPPRAYYNYPHYMSHFNGGSVGDISPAIYPLGRRSRPPMIAANNFHPGYGPMLDSSFYEQPDGPNNRFHILPYQDEEHDANQFIGSPLMAPGYGSGAAAVIQPPYEYDPSEPEGRFFGLFNRNSGITITSSTNRGIFRTRTYASLLQTTLTSTSVVYCVPAVEFAVGSSAVTCSAVGRRRRDLVSLLDMLEEAKRQNPPNDQDMEESESIISPYQVEPLETSEAPSLGLSGGTQRHSRDLSDPLVNKDVVDSSQQEVDEADPEWDRIKKRSFFGLLQQTSYISITNCTTFITTVTSSLTLGTAGAVTCLPSGLSVC